MKYLIIAMLILVFVPMLAGEFQFDDYPNIVDRDGWGLNQHRVLQNYVNYGIFQVFGAYSLPFHMVSLFWHIAVCWLLMLICDEFGYKYWAVLLYGVHPVVGGTVSYIIQSSVIMATCFCLASFLMYLRKRYIFAVMAWIVACFCKEIAWQFPLVIFAWEWSARRKSKWFLGAVIAGEIVAVISLFRMVVWDRSHFHFNTVERLCTEGRIMFSYIGKMLYPNPCNLTINHDYMVSGDHLAIYLFVIIALLLFMVSKRIWAFAVLAYCSLHLMESTVLNLELAYEHRLYMPMAFMVPAIASVKVSKKTYGFILAWLLGVCFWYQTLWHSEYRMWKHCVEVTPDCARANVNMAKRYMLKGDGFKALWYYKRVFMCTPKRAGLYQKMAIEDLTVNEEALGKAVSNFVGWVKRWKFQATTGEVKNNEEDTRHD